MTVHNYTCVACANGDSSSAIHVMPIMSPSCGFSRSLINPFTLITSHTPFIRVFALPWNAFIHTDDLRRFRELSHAWYCLTSTRQCVDNNKRWRRSCHGSEFTAVIYAGYRWPHLHHVCIHLGPENTTNHLMDTWDGWLFNWVGKLNKKVELVELQVSMSHSISSWSTGLFVVFHIIREKLSV